MNRHYDIIGDIHGHAAELKSLLMLLGYQRHGDGFRHPDRKVVFDEEKVSDEEKVPGLFSSVF